MDELNNNSVNNELANEVDIKTPRKKKKNKKKKNNNRNINTNKKGKVSEIKVEEVVPVKEEEQKEEEETSSSKFKESNTYAFIRAFHRRLLDDKFFLISFLLTIVFFTYLGSIKLENSEGMYEPIFKNKNKSDAAAVTVDDKIDPSKSVVEDLDVSDFVGIYSREVEFTSDIKINEQCSIDSYKVIYEVKKDKSIIKYFYNDCIGTIKVWSDTLAYTSSGDAQYISAHSINYLFAGSSIKEVDGDTYRLDSDISSVKEKNNLKNVQLYFFDNSFAIMTYTNLIYIKGNSIIYNMNDEYKNAGGNLEQLVYKSPDKNQFNFIVFYNNEEINCYNDVDEDDYLIYKIYTIKYDSDTMTLGNAKEVVSRNRNDLCTNWNSDLNILKG